MLTTIAAAAAALEAGKLKAADLVEESLAAIDEHGAATNAFITVDALGARAAAAAVDRERATGVRRGPLHGIPISLKDLIDVAGVVTTAGSRVLDGRIPTRDATVITRLREAGAILLGRANLHEFAFGTTSEHSAFGPVRNPLDPSRSAGGSSGGSAAAVARGMGLASIGTDTGGSIRIPAAACGVVGLKATIGEVPTDGVIPLSHSLDHVGPLTKTVQDAAWVHAVLAGEAARILGPRPTPGLRLKHLAGYFDGPLDAVVREAFDRALGELRGAGVTITTADWPAAGRISETYSHVVWPEAAHAHAPYLDTHADGYTESVRSRLLMGRTVPAVSYLAGRDARHTFRSDVDALFDDVDALVLATMPIVAPPLGAETVAVDEANPAVAVRGAMLRHTQLFNISGHPAISLPIATPGLPVGLQLVGRIGMTAALLDIAAACERVVSGPWPSAG